MTSPSALKPAWLDHACPTWCVREHTTDDHPEDRRHQSAEEVFEIVRSDFPGPEGGDGNGVVVHEEWLVVGHRGVTEPAARTSVWIHVGQHEDRAVSFDLTRESAGRLRDALTRCLDRLA